MERRIAANRRKTWALFVALFAILGGIGALISWLSGSLAPGVLALVFAGVYALIVYYQACRLAIRLNKAKQADLKSHRVLYQLVENLSIRVGLPVPKIYVIDDPAINAFAAGNKPEKSIIGVTQGALENLTRPELEGVLAHEMSHIVNRDVRVGTVAFALVVAIIFLLDMSRFFIFSRRDRDGRAALIGFAVFILAAIFAFFGAKLIQASISRRREYLADTTGAQLTRYPEGLASALDKISQHGSKLQKTSSASAHLFFANPLSSGWLTRLFSTHPPLKDRVQALRRLENEGY